MIIYTTSSQNLAKQIKKLRKKHKITQSVLAHSIGAHKDTLARWEQWVNVPSIDILLRIMRTLSAITEEEITVSVSAVKK